MMLLSPQPETFNSIFIINSWYWGNYSFILIISTVFLIFVVVFLFFKKYYKNFNIKNLIWIILFFWLLTFFNSFYNSVYDVLDNQRVRGLTIEQKRLKRVYNFERSQGLGYTYYDILSFLPKAEKIIPKHSKLLCLIPYVLNPYFYYNLYPDYPATIKLKEVEYILFYAPLENYQYQKNQHLYQINQDGSKEDLGKYEIIKMFDNDKIIFKRLK